MCILKDNSQFHYTTQKNPDNHKKLGPAVLANPQKMRSFNERLLLVNVALLPLSAANLFHAKWERS